jgi:hypothetical protein
MAARAVPLPTLSSPVIGLPRIGPARDCPSIALVLLSFFFVATLTLEIALFSKTPQVILPHTVALADEHEANP